MTDVRNGTLLVKLSAAPAEGAANEALIDLLASTLRVPKRMIRLVSGARSRTKRLVIAGSSAADLDERLAVVIAGR